MLICIITPEQMNVNPNDIHSPNKYAWRNIMTNCKTFAKASPFPSDGILEAGTRIITNKLTDSANLLTNKSGDKYERKAVLIENAEDLSTKEKLDALDQNYNRHTEEVWESVIAFASVSFAVISILTGGPNIMKYVHRLIA